MQDGFLIGALLTISLETLTQRVHAGYAAAGFTDLRPSYDPVFQYLRPEGERVVNLARRIHMSKQALGYLVAELEARGYLEHIPDPTDHRAQLVRRTARGWEVNRTARQLVQAVQEEWATHLGQDRMQQLLSILGDLAHLIGAQYPGSVAERATPRFP